MKSKIITALISFAVALAVWLYVVTIVSPNSDKTFYNIPVGIQGDALLQERGLMITSTDISTIKLQLGGDRINLNKLSSSNIVVDVDVSKIYEAGTYDLTYSMTFGELPSSAITVLSKTPGSVQVVVEERISSPIPVQVQYKGTVDENFTADTENAVLSADTVTVTGPKPVIDKIAMARIEVDLDGCSESINGRFPITLCDKEGKPVDAQAVTVSTKEIGVSVRVALIKAIDLKITLTDGGGITAQDCTVTIDPPTIEVAGSKAQLDALTVLNLGIIDLSTITENTVLTFKINEILQKQYPEITYLTGTPEATVSISIPELTTRTMTVKNIRAINVAADQVVELSAKAMEIQVRGPKEKVEALTEDDIVITVDFTGVNTGSFTLKASIDCGDPEIGAVYSDEPYTVSATVSKAAA